MSVETQDAASQLLKNKYNLHKSPEAEIAAERTQMRTGEKAPQDPIYRIQNYLNRFHEIVDRGGPQRHEHNLDLIKGRFHARYVIKPDEIPESFWENQRRIIRERGQGADLEYVDFEELKRQNTEALISDQRSSLDKWIDYLSSPDAPYQDSLKYFTLRNVLNMAEYDKEKKQYPQRSRGTTKPFPDLNREALAYVLDAVEKKYKGQSVDFSSLDQEDSKEFEALLKAENFPKLYAWAIEKVTPASEEELSATHGEWVKYNQGGDHMPLVQSLQGHGTGWCTAGESTAQVQLQGGDFYVYYSFDREGKPTIPRAAIRMEGDRIAEIRGIEAEQNLDSQIVSIVDEKLKEFSDGASYQKKVADMRRLTDIENKMSREEELTNEELYFLYEIDSQIEGFGFERDPRIGEIRSSRSPEVDMLIIFNCEPEQIARKASEINESTRAFVGRLTPGIFDILSQYNIEHIYTSFPEGRIRIEQDFAVEPIDLKEFNERREQYNEGIIDESLKIQVSDFAPDMMLNQNFATLKNQELKTLIHLTVRDLFQDEQIHTSEEMWGNPEKGTTGRIKELGLEFCPPETGPQYRLKYTDQPISDRFYIGMEPIPDRHGSPYVFRLERYGDGLWFDSYWAGPGDRWNPEDRFVFSLRKPR
ncbi:MAG: hypothetical protein HY427_02300 [Candidatus Levybacteria bacterium]|nr:hypothetical protein [Candidatus Levybacteria bacterium]